MKTFFHLILLISLVSCQKKETISQSFTDSNSNINQERTVLESTNDSPNIIFGVSPGAYCVIVDNKVKYFTYEGGWNEMPQVEFNLPNGYKAVFGVSPGAYCVVVDNKVKYFTYEGGWNEMPQVEFILY